MMCPAYFVPNMTGFKCELAKCPRGNKILPNGGCTPCEAGKYLTGD